jgi:serine/threonine protein kinase
MNTGNYIDSDLPPQYTPITIRGAGAFGYVIEAMDKNLGTRVAIKRTHKVGKKLSREFQILEQLNDHENIIKMHRTFYSVNDDARIIQNTVFEYVEGKIK